MKKIILTIFCFGMLFPLLGSAARPYGVEEIPNVQVGNRYRFTSNPDGVLSPSAVAEIDSLCYSLRHRALAQVAVVAVEDIRGDDLFSFAHTLFSQWGVGRADSDNGLGILLVVDRREVRFVTGPGLEGVLPDALCKRIQMRYMLPYFREGDYSAGMVAGLRGIGARGQRARFGRQRRFPGCGRFAGVGGFPDRLSGRPRAAGHHAGRILPFQALSPVSCFRIGVAIAESRRADGPLQPVRRHLPLRQMRFRREAAVPKCTQR